MQAVLTDIPWAIVLILLPLAAGMVSFVWPRLATGLGLGTVVITVLAVVGLGWQLHYIYVGTYRHTIGGWGAPLGIDLYADGLSLLMLTLTALVALGVSVYSCVYFERQQAIRFWPVWLLLLAALNAMFLTRDIFNLYVTIELLGLSAVTLTALLGGKAALDGAMRYLLATLLGSLFYLLGVALLYHSYGSVDITILAARVEAVCAGVDIREHRRDFLPLQGMRRGDKSKRRHDDLAVQPQRADQQLESDGSVAHEHAIAHPDEVADSALELDYVLAAIREPAPVQDVIQPGEKTLAVADVGPTHMQLLGKRRGTAKNRKRRRGLFLTGLNGCVHGL